MKKEMKTHDVIDKLLDIMKPYIDNAQVESIAFHSRSIPYEAGGKETLATMRF